MDPWKFEAMVGRMITGVVVKEGDGPPRSQVFLIFSDGFYTELYSDAPIKAASLWPGGRDEVRAYMAPEKRVVFEAYQTPST